jgi:hypothetical protein
MNKMPKLEFRPRYLAWFAVVLSTLLAGCGGGGDGGRDPILGGGGTAILVPAVSAVTPLSNATGVPVNTSVITATFNKAMDASTISASTFTLACPSGTAITGTVSYMATTHVATLSLGNNLPGNTTCTATITSAVRDDTGNAMAGAYAWSFTTGVAPETVPPTVSATVPEPNQTSVPINSRVTASFSEAMDPLTITASNFTLACPTGTAITGTVDYVVNGNVAIFTPSANLPLGTACRATISTGVRDVTGNAMSAPFTWTFNTIAAATPAAALDTTPPVVISTLPRSDAVDVPFNSLISATFSEGMIALNMVPENFTVDCPVGADVEGSVRYVVSSNIVTFYPDENLPGNTLCRATISTGVNDLAGNFMASSYSWNFTTGPAPDTEPPRVSSTVPRHQGTGVPFNTLVTASFSEPMDPLTITTASFNLVCPVGTTVTGLVRYVADGNIAVFTLPAALPASTTCRATISDTVKDVAGNNMLRPYEWTFTTGAAPDTTAPMIDLTVPISNAIGVPLNTMVTARFTEPMNPLTITPPATFTVACPVGTAVTGVVSYAVNSRIATFNPDGNLPVSTVCRATVANSVRDLAGNAMLNPYTWDFTTGIAPDITPPTVTLRDPAINAVDVPLNSAVHATFSEDMDPLTIVTATFTLAQGLNQVQGQLLYDALSRIATFTPDAALSSGTTYTATVSNDVEDLAGNNMVLDDVWSFSTGTGLAPGAVALGNAASFGIMATSAITSTGATQINGDVSLEPGTSQGIPPPQVSGTIHVNDATSTLARADLLTAYNDLKALPPGTTVLGGTDLGASFPGPAGIAPGTYTSGSTMLVSTTLTLNGGGNANAVWVFQIGSSLTTTANVMLTNGAQAKNVFWVPTQDATIGVGTIFNGNIIAGRDTTTQTGVVVNGRILTGAITAGTMALDSTTVNVPAP